MKRSIRFRYYLLLSVVSCAMYSTITKNGERKCQQNSSIKYGEYGDSKYTFTHTRKREITQCDTQACSRSNNAETNSFFTPLPNPIKFCD